MPSARDRAASLKDPDAPPPANAIFNDVDRRNLIIEATRKGLAMRHAAGIARVTRQTVEGWIERGKLQIDPETGAPTGPFGEFYVELECARAEGVSRLWDELNTLGEGGQIVEEEYDKDGNLIRVKKAPPRWESKAWQLERPNPDEYSLRTTQKIEGDKKITIQIEYRKDWRTLSADDGDVIEGELKPIAAIEAGVGELVGEVVDK